MTMATYNVLSLFAGIGGIDLGLERTGRFTTVAYSEVEPYACRIMARHFPDAANVGDITKLHCEIKENGTTYIENTKTGECHSLPPIDIVVGGFPCQDISLAGRGAGIDGEQSGLWVNHANVIGQLRPRGVIVENVAAITRRGLGRVLGDLAARGYDAEWDCIPAAALGAPHRRDRAFIVAYPAGIGMEGNRPARVEEPYTQAETWLPRRGSAGTRTGHWETEPGVGRMANGFPDWVDRIRCLGNAVVPQVAEHVGRILLDRIGEPHA